MLNGQSKIGYIRGEPNLQPPEAGCGVSDIQTERSAELLEQQLELLKALADRPLTLPPIFVRITGSITAGLLLRQTLYWMGKTETEGGWFYKRLPEFQDEMCMGQKEFRTARSTLEKAEFIESKRRGTPPVVWFRANVTRVIQAVQNAKAIMPKRRNQFCQKDTAIPPKWQNPNSGERAQSYKEAETTRDYPERGTPRRSPLVNQSSETPSKNPRLSLNALMICKDRFWKEYAQVKGRALDPDCNRDADTMRRLRIAAIQSGLGLVQAKMMLREHPEWKMWPHLDLLDSQHEIPFIEQPTPALNLPPGLQIMMGGQLWQSICESITTTKDLNRFKKWLRPTKAVGVLDGALFVQVPTSEFKESLLELEPFLFKEIDGSPVRQIKFLTREELTDEFK